MREIVQYPERWLLGACHASSSLLEASNVLHPSGSLG